MFSKNDNVAVTKRMAKEFIEYRLGIEPNKKNINRLAAHLILFEKELASQSKPAG